MKKKRIAVDFDGTCVDHRYPDVGTDAPGAVEVLREFVSAGHALILWTMRSGPELDAAVAWFAKHELPLLGVNANPEQTTWSTSPKAYAHHYIDDAAIGCPLITVPGFARKCVEWGSVRDAILGSLPAPREYPRGRLGADDDGALQVRMAVKDGTVLVDFGKPVAWIGLGPDDALAMASLLLKNAAEAQR